MARAVKATIVSGLPVWRDATCPLSARFITARMGSGPTRVRVANGHRQFVGLGIRFVPVAVLITVGLAPTLARTQTVGARAGLPKAIEILAPSNASASPQAMLLGVNCV